jgi:intermediate cleaving peptidase 55
LLVTPGITALEYAQRRAKLADLLPEKSVAIIPSGTIKYRSGPVFYPFHQNTDFLYLTGFLEPNSVAIIDKRDSEPVFRLWVREKDERAELWEGARSGTQAALDVFNADESRDVRKLVDGLADVVKGAEFVYTDAPGSFKPSTAFERYMSSTGLSSSESGLSKLLSGQSGTTVKSLAALMSELRVIKSDAEINNMRIAGKLSGRAITGGMRTPWIRERHLHSYLDHQFRVNGCDREAYVPVVAGGQNALGIHYVRNDAEIPEEDMILVDAGGVSRSLSLGIC